MSVNKLYNRLKKIALYHISVCQRHISFVIRCSNCIIHLVYAYESRFCLKKKKRKQNKAVVTMKTRRMRGREGEKRENVYIALNVVKWYMKI